VHPRSAIRGAYQDNGADTNLALPTIPGDGS
jgi:hypothetical protein